MPHRGFSLLREWGQERPLGSFVFTSNVDGQFQKAGFPENEVLECHGSIHHLQCTRNCGQEIWSADKVQVDVDDATIRARSAFPLCPGCGAIARPNILMFGDWDWDRTRYWNQQSRYAAWLRRVEGGSVVAIELGAGLAIPTVRHECESRANLLIRINPREADTPPGSIALPLGALEALSEINELLRSGK
jgi:NAD-dependent SIR2 family protein deacetylase